MLAAAPLTSHRSIRRPCPYAVNLLGLVSSTLLCHGALILDINLFFFFFAMGTALGTTVKNMARPVFRELCLPST